MNRLLTIFLLCALLSVSAWSQEAEEALPDGLPEEAEVIEAEVTEADEVPEEPEPDPEFDETGLDEQGFANEDDDFDPSEKIPTDQSIEFPTDI